MDTCETSVFWVEGMCLQKSHESTVSVWDVRCEFEHVCFRFDFLCVCMCWGAGGQREQHKHAYDSV